MSQQLVKKGANGKHENVMPKSWIEAIKDKNTGQTLVEVLQGFNMYFLSYNGNTSATRNMIPSTLRRKGLWISYVKYDGNVYTEWYAADEIDDNSWGDSSNWRVGNNTLVGDITISANGNWVINGAETEFKAVGEKGNTPLLRVANNRLQVSYDLGDTYRDVTNNPVYTKFRWLATSGDTQANNVGRIQASIDEGKTWTNMSNDFINNLHISRYIGVSESLPTSGIAEGTIYAKGPYYAEDDTLNDNPIYRLWVYAWKGSTLAWQDNGEFTSITAGIVQETGNSETEVMSQAAVTKKLSELASEVNDLGGTSNVLSINLVAGSSYNTTTIAAGAIPVDLSKGDYIVSISTEDGELDSNGIISAYFIDANDNNAFTTTLNLYRNVQVNLPYHCTHVGFYKAGNQILKSGTFNVLLKKEGKIEELNKDVEGLNKRLDYLDGGESQTVSLNLVAGKSYNTTTIAAGASPLDLSEGDYIVSISTSDGQLDSNGNVTAYFIDENSGRAFNTYLNLYSNVVVNIPYSCTHVGFYKSGAQILKSGTFDVSFKKEGEVDRIIAELEENEPKYKNKKFLYIGDSISTKDNYKWKGFLEKNYLLQYVRDLSGELAPANGGITIMPPITESNDIAQKSIWYRCANNRMSIYEFDVISLFGGTNDMTNENLVIGNVEDVAFVDNVNGFSSDDNVTDVRPDNLSLASALRGCILMLKRDFPNKEIIIPTVMPCGGQYGNWTDQSSGLRASEAIAEMQMKMAEKYELKAIPLYWSMNYPNMDNNRIWVKDGVHPNMQGALNIQRMFAQILCL